MIAIAILETIEIRKSKISVEKMKEEKFCAQPSLGSGDYEYSTTSHRGIWDNLH